MQISGEIGGLLGQLHQDFLVGEALGFPEGFRPGLVKQGGQIVPVGGGGGGSSQGALCYQRSSTYPCWPPTLYSPQVGSTEGRVVQPLAMRAQSR